MNTRWVERAVLLAASVALVQTGCGDDADPPPATETDGGPDASAGSGGESGSGGQASGGAAGDGGSGGGSGGAAPAEAGAAEGSAPESGAEAAAPEASTADASDAAAPAGKLLAVSTDYFSETEVATVDLATRTVTANVTVPDGDAVAKASGGYAFILERTHGRLHILNAAGEVDRTIQLIAAEAGAPEAGALVLNPRDVVVRPHEVDFDRAYVSMYGASRVDVFDLETGRRVTSVDLSALLDSGDTDGSVDVDAGTYVPTTGLVYFAVQRIDLNSATLETDYRVQCPAVPSLLIAIDPSDNTLVDLNGAAAGEALELDLVGPSDIDFDGRSNRLFIVSNGCVTAPEAGATFSRERHGIEVIDLDDNATSVAFAPADQNFYQSLMLLDETGGVVQSFDEFFTTQYHQWPLGAASLGDALSDVPSAAVVASSSTLIGLQLAATDAGISGSVVSYAIEEQSGTAIVDDIWTGTLSNVGGAVLLP